MELLWFLWDFVKFWIVLLAVVLGLPMLGLFLLQIFWKMMQSKHEFLNSVAHWILISVIGVIAIAILDVIGFVFCGLIAGHRYKFVIEYILD